MDKYVGNHGGAYVDGDGLTRQFTYVDHDQKTSITPHVISTKEMEEIRESLSLYREEVIGKILSTPPSICPLPFQDFTMRGDRKKIEWNEIMLRDEGVDTWRLHQLLTLLQNKDN